MIGHIKSQLGKAGRQSRFDYLRKPRWIIGIGMVVMVVVFVAIILVFANYIQVYLLR